jgi:hypothetical protein
VLRVVVIDVEGIRTISAIGCIRVGIKSMRTSLTNVVYCFCLNGLILIVSVSESPCWTPSAGLHPIGPRRAPAPHPLYDLRHGLDSSCHKSNTHIALR